MSQKTSILLIAVLFGFSYAVPFQKREVPQEHSHEFILTSVRKSLQKSNPLEIKDPVFGLLGDKAASEGAGKVTNFKCLQRKTADQAFTNAKADKDIEGMTNALIYATLERNTGAVGKASDTCDEPATNPEVNALRQHQDPASDGAQKANKELVLELARQIASIGGKPEDAALSATFAPGQLGDPTAKGNSCDNKDDPKGCIYTKNLIQVEATPEEIRAAVKAGGSSSSSSSSDTSSSSSSSDTSSSSSSSDTSSSSTTCSKDNKKAVQKRHQVSHNPQTSTKAAQRPNESTKIVPRDDLSYSSEKSVEKRTSENKDSASPLQSKRVVKIPNLNKRLSAVEIEEVSSFPKNKRDNDGPDFDFDNDKVKRDCGGNNVQTFTGSKGGPPPEVIETTGSTRPFSVNGNTFVGKKVALQRSCDIQHNACANAANSGAGGSVAECEDQQKKCIEAASANTKRSVEKRSNLSSFTKRASVDLGSCSNPTVEFKEGFDGRKEASFKAVNQKDFNHGSTQKLKITSDFICQRLESSCKASQQAIDSCKSASEAASADTFNKAFA